MKKIETTILQSKLKRHKIAFSNDLGKIVIGKPKADFITIFGLIIFPIAAALVIAFLLILNNLEIFEHNFTKIIVAIIVLFSVGIFNLNRIKAKRKSNNTLKTLDYKSIKIESESKSLTYNVKNTKGFIYAVEPVNDEIYEAKLFLIDKDENQHQILGFDEMNEQYAYDDLQWFANYFTNHLKNII